MQPLGADSDSHGTNATFIDTLSSFSRLHRAQRWEGTFGEFLANIPPANPSALARSSHEYIWDCCAGMVAAPPPTPPRARARASSSSASCSASTSRCRAWSITSRPRPPAPTSVADCC